jgi:hypothetical protein
VKTAVWQIEIKPALSRDGGAMKTPGAMVMFLSAVLALAAGPMVNRCAAAQDALTPPAAAATPDRLDHDDQMVWNREWSFYASRYTLLDGAYYACAQYEHGYPSSLHETAQGLVEDRTRTRSVKYSANMSRDVSIKPNFADAQVAVQALPTLDIGAYGHVHSVQVVQVTGPKAMLIKAIWLIDADRLEDEMRQAKAKADTSRSIRNDRGSRSDRSDQVEQLYQFRQELADHQQKQHDLRTQGVLLLGFDTQGVKPSERWRGPQGQGLDIAITGKKTIAYTRTGSSYARDIEVNVALPVTAFRGRISQDQFIKMLATRNLTLKQFLDMTAEEKKKDAQNAIANVIVRVEANRPAETPSDEAKDQKAERKSTRSTRSTTRSRRSARSTRESSSDKQSTPEKKDDD